MEEGNSNNHIANNVARATVAALDWNSTPGARKDAVSFLESLHTQIPISFLLLLIKTQLLNFCGNFQWFKVIKTGYVRILASTSFVLVKRDWFSILFVDVVLRSKGTDFMF
ncbi:hypothetical protein DKX38_019461 [Salix brachista]|uniref:Uncharacterized protein n=1 Tax=Salix brachista TaxID=2182728 RepID=A0A5N5KGA1_9ROSI|nr:hypothetical protein DKX38_019461 [Salix brachista]